MYNVLLLNDDYTPFDFVIKVMKDVFRKNEAEAELITLQIHLQGKGLCGTYPKEVAEFLRDKTLAMAKAEQHPLMCVTEKESPSPNRGPRP